MARGPYDSAGMGSPLEGARLKLERGGEHVQSLLAEARTFLEGNPYRIKVVERGDQRVFVLRASADPPPRLAVVAGDVPSVSDQSRSSSCTAVGSLLQPHHPLRRLLAVRD